MQRSLKHCPWGVAVERGALADHTKFTPTKFTTIKRANGGPSFRRHFRPTIDLITWFLFATARLLANAMAAARGEAALKKAELAACAET